MCFVRPLVSSAVNKAARVFVDRKSVVELGR